MCTKISRHLFLAGEISVVLLSFYSFRFVLLCFCVVAALSRFVSFYLQTIKLFQNEESHQPSSFTLSFSLSLLQPPYCHISSVLSDTCLVFFISFISTDLKIGGISHGCCTGGHWALADVFMVIHAVSQRQWILCVWGTFRGIELTLKIVSVTLVTNYLKPPSLKMTVILSSLSLSHDGVPTRKSLEIPFPCPTVGDTGINRKLEETGEAGNPYLPRDSLGVQPAWFLHSVAAVGPVNVTMEAQGSDTLSALQPPAASSPQICLQKPRSTLLLPSFAWSTLRFRREAIRLPLLMWSE